MNDALLGLAGVALGAILGTLGGFLTARQQGRQALALAKANATEERERQLRQLAVDIAKLELERNRGSPHMAAEHVAVLIRLLKQFDVELADDDTALTAVQRFRSDYCRQCGTLMHGGGDTCQDCGGW